MTTPPLLSLQPRKILVRATNWIGDAIMTTPAVRTIRHNFPDAEISVLAKPWVADIFAASPRVDDIIAYQKESIHRGLRGLHRLAGELRRRRFDLAILLQNAFEAALVARLAGIPARAGYCRDGRSLLLTHGVKIDPAIRKTHQVLYYQDLLRQLGLVRGPNELELALPEQARRWALDYLNARGDGPVIGLNPGAAYGPAKCWPAARYGRLAARLGERLGARVLVFGTLQDGEAARFIRSCAPDRVLDLTGKTKLAEAMALIERCQVFVTNDSGLMHVAAALKTPLVAIFGSTDSVATGPYSQTATVIQKDLSCRPCLQTHCRSDFACMEMIGVEEVEAAVLHLAAKALAPGAAS